MNQIAIQKIEMMPTETLIKLLKLCHEYINNPSDETYAELTGLVQEVKMLSITTDIEIPLSV